MVGGPSPHDDRRGGGDASQRPSSAFVETADAGRDVLEPPDGAEFPQILRTTAYRWWRSVLGLLLSLVAYIVLLPLVFQAVATAGWSVGDRDDDRADYLERALDFEVPVGLLAANVAILALVPVSWFLVRVLHRVRPRWLSSVQPRLRLPWLLQCLAIAVVVLLVVLLVSLPLRTVDEWQPQEQFVAFAVVVVLTSPLQAYAEEVLFRGYVLQALGSLVRQAWFGVVASAVLFALLHGTQSPAVFVDRLAFGLVAGWIVLRTGGLEAAIAAHVVNNVYTFLFAGLTSSIAELRAVTEIGWVDAAVDVGGFAVFGLVAVLVAQRLRLRTRVDLAAGR